jgi:transcription antitermination factor NusA-like protein
MPTSSIKLNQRIEAVCQAGCEAVRASIKTLESGHHEALTEDLSEQEREQILKELKTIMSVYDHH